MGEGDGDGWLRARNYKGEEGYVPHNYLDVEREQTPTTHGLTNQISFSSVDYTVENEDDIGKQSPEQETVIITQQQQQEPLQEETGLFIHLLIRCLDLYLHFTKLRGTHKKYYYLQVFFYFNNKEHRSCCRTLWFTIF